MNLSNSYITLSFVFIFSIFASYLIFANQVKYAFMIMTIPAAFILAVNLPIKKTIYIIAILIFFPIYIEIFGKDIGNTATFFQIFIFLLFIIKKILSKETLLKNYKFLFPFMILILFGFISTFSASETVHFQKSIRALLAFIASISLFLLVMQIDFKDEKDKVLFINKILEFIVVLLTVQILIGILIYYFPETMSLFKIFLTRGQDEITTSITDKFVKRLNSIILTPESTGEIIAVIMPYILYKLFAENKKHFLVYLSILLIGLLLAVTRSGILLCFLTFVLYFIFFNVGMLGKLKWGIVFLFIIIGFLILFPSTIDLVYYRFSIFFESVQGNASSLKAINREATFIDGFEFLTATISFFGNGLLSPKLFGVFESDFHNLIFTIIFRFGLVGALFYFYFFIVIFYRLFDVAFLKKSNYSFLYKTLFLSYFIFHLNELKFEFIRTAPYHNLVWLLFSIYYLATIRLKNVDNIKVDSLVKSRHTGENRCPGVLQPIEITGFRLSPE